MKRFVGLLVGLLGCRDAVSPRSRTVEVLPAPAQGDVAALVRAEQARPGGQDLLVYVGAHWCEPCRRFHAAAAAGQLDAKLGQHVRLLEFDLDRDNVRLRDAGYVSELIPLFALPGPDGRASGRQIEGSIKGEGAVDEIAPRLRELLHSNAANPR